jgi:hypothetical protein
MKRSRHSVLLSFKYSVSDWRVKQRLVAFRSSGTMSGVDFLSCEGTFAFLLPSPCLKRSVC